MRSNWSKASTVYLYITSSPNQSNLHLLKMCDYKSWEENSLELELFTMDRDRLVQLEALLEARLAMLEALVATMRRQVELMEARLSSVRKGM
ncbi:hypothetical protein ACOSP7_009484 [Xanthoceras sorbifolium]